MSTRTTEQRLQALEGRMEEIERRQRETAAVMIAGASLIEGRIAELERQQAETETILLALEKGPPAGWSTPEYSRRGPVDTSTSRGRQTLDRRVHAALALHSPLTAADVERAVGGTNVQVRVALNRLIHKGLVTWGRKERGGTIYCTSEEGEKSHAG